VRRRDPLADPTELARRVYAFAAYRVGPGPDAEDVTSETFERALKYRKSYKPSQGTPVSWMLGIARRVIADRVAAHAVETPVADTVEVADRQEMEQQTVAKLNLQSAMRRLPENDRELLALRYGADLTSAQIAELLGQPADAVLLSLQWALQRLRAIMDPEVAGDVDLAV
jgi:RNA polymerase sigma-70 factor (ECF subfamily)